MKYTIVALTALILSLNSNAQINFDYTDSLINQQKQYIIRFDVANGNIYVPIKKKLKPVRNKFNFFKRDLIQLKDSVIVPLYKDTVMDGQVIKWKYALQRIPNPVITVKENHNDNNPGNSKNGSEGSQGSRRVTDSTRLPRILAAARYLKPSVGSFIRLIFENVPKNVDVNVNAEFLDKNLENASTFEGFLNRYGSSLDTAVRVDVKGITDSARKTELIKKIDTTQKAISDTLNKLRNILDTAVSSLDSMQVKLNAYAKGNPKDITKSVLDAITPQIALIVQLTNALKNSVDTSNFINEIKNKPNEIIEATKELNKLAVDKMVTVQTIKKDIDFFNDKISSLGILKDAIDSLFAKVKLQKDELEIVKKRHDSLLLALYDSVYNRRTIYVQPIQVPNNDISLLKVTFKTQGKTDEIYREIMLKNRFGFKLDFSTGFIGTGLLDSNYRIVPSPGTVKDTATIIADQKGNFSIGFALLAHAYFRTGGRINFAINSGLMLNGSNQTINYLAGLSLPLGLEQRFIISGGLAYGKVKRLTSDYEPNKSYPANKLNLSSGVPYTESWQKSWYIGFSYNLSSLTSSSRKIVIAR